MKFEDYCMIMKGVPEISGLSFEPAWLWFHRDWLPRAITSLNGCTGKMIRLPMYTLNKYGKNILVNMFRKNVFQANELVTDIILHSEIESIPEGAFEGCKRLERITIPMKVREIGVNTFKGCESLLDVYYEGTEERWKEIQRYHFPGNDALERATIHFGCDFSVIDSKNDE